MADCTFPPRPKNRKPRKPLPGGYYRTQAFVDLQTIVTKLYAACEEAKAWLDNHHGMTCRCAFCAVSHYGNEGGGPNDLSNGDIAERDIRGTIYVLETMMTQLETHN